MSKVLAFVIWQQVIILQLIYWGFIESYLHDFKCSVMGYTLLLSLIEYKTLVMRGDLERANALLPSIPREHHNRYMSSHDCQMIRILYQGQCFCFICWGFLEKRMASRLVWYMSRVRTSVMDVKLILFCWNLFYWRRNCWMQLLLEQLK